MKNLFKCLMAVTLAVAMLTGCGGNSSSKRETVTTCEGTLDNMEEKFTFNASGDKITTQVEEFTFGIEELGFSLADYQADHSIVDLDALKEMIYSQLFGTTELEGVSVEIKDEEDHLAFVVTTDYDKADLDALADAGLIEKGSVTTSYISLEKTVEGLEGKGMTCSETEK